MAGVYQRGGGGGFGREDLCVPGEVRQVVQVTGGRSRGCSRDSAQELCMRFEHWLWDLQLA